MRSSVPLTQATASGQAPIVWDRVIKEGEYVLFLPLGDNMALYHDKPFVVIAMTFMQLELSSVSVWLVVNICNGKDGLVGHPLSTFALMLPQDVFRMWL